MAAIGNRGTVTEFAGFDADADVQKMREAMKGAGKFETEASVARCRVVMAALGTNEATIIEVIAHRTIAQRQRIKEAYKQAVGKDLADDLSSELSGNFRSVVLGLLMLAPVYDAYELRNSMKGAGTEEAGLIDILASRSNDEIKTINAFYKKQYEKSLEDAVSGDTSGMFRRVLVSLLTAGRDESNSVDEAQAVLDAKDIYEAGEARWGTDEVKFLTVLCVRNRNHLMRAVELPYRKDIYEAGEARWGTDKVKFLTVLGVRNRNHLMRVFEEYKKISGKDIEESIKREMSGCLEDVFLAIVKCIRDKPAFFAERLYRSMKGLGTTDSVLIRIMVARAEIDMLDIKAQFLKMYGKTLYSFIKGDTSGDYGKILLQLCGGE